MRRSCFDYEHMMIIMMIPTILLINKEDIGVWQNNTQDNKKMTTICSKMSFEISWSQHHFIRMTAVHTTVALND